METCDIIVLGWVPIYSKIVKISAIYEEFLSPYEEVMQMVVVACVYYPLQTSLSPLSLRFRFYDSLNPKQPVSRAKD